MRSYVIEYEGWDSTVTSGSDSRCLAGFLFNPALGCVDFCDDSKCFHGGTCATTLSSFDCSCTSGWSGDRCEIDVDECSTGSLHSTVCHNGATCVNYDGGFNCSCQPGWQGALCNLDIDECLVDAPCRNGASCLNTNGSYVCNCEDGWMGENCGTDVDECEIYQPACQHGGTCVNLNGSFECLCLREYTGPYCREAEYASCHSCRDHSAIAPLSNGTLDVNQSTRTTTGCMMALAKQLSFETAVEACWGVGGRLCSFSDLARTSAIVREPYRTTPTWTATPCQNVTTLTSGCQLTWNVSSLSFGLEQNLTSALDTACCWDDRERITTVASQSISPETSCYDCEYPNLDYDSPSQAGVCSESDVAVKARDCSTESRLSVEFRVATDYCHSQGARLCRGQELLSTAPWNMTGIDQHLFWTSVQLLTQHRYCLRLCV